MKAKFHPEEIKKANRSCRAKGAIGSRSAVIRVVEALNIEEDLMSALDYGAGKTARQAQMLRESGWDVTAHEFGDNFDPKHHSPKALDYTYPVVYASNVLNVQSSLHMLRTTIEQIWDSVDEDGVFICNYPRQPRYLPGLTPADLENELDNWFTEVEVTHLPLRYTGGRWVAPRYNGVLWKCRP